MPIYLMSLLKLLTRTRSFLFSSQLPPIYSFHIDKGVFQKAIKQSKPLFVKKVDFLKKNYRPISRLPFLSKAFDRCSYSQIYQNFNETLSRIKCGFRKGFSTYSWIAMIEKWRRNLDKGGSFIVLLTNLSKSFDSIVHVSW